MKQKLFTMAGALVFLTVLGKFYAQPVLAQVRAALVSDVDNPARGFVQLRFSASLPPGVGSPSIYYDPQYLVPTGKRLVIDTISAVSQNLGNIQASGGLWLLEGPNAGSCSSGVAFANAVVILPLTFQGDGVFGGFVYGGVARVQSYLDSGQCLAVRIDHNALVTNTASYSVTVSGHLVSLP